MTNRLDTEPAATATDGLPPTRTRRRRLMRLVWLGIVFLLLIALIGAALWAWIGAVGINTVDAQLEIVRPWLLMWRVGLFALVIGFWPRWSHWLAVRRQWSLERRQALLDLRWRVAAWWAILEVFLVQNLMGKVVG